MNDAESWRTALLINNPPHWDSWPAKRPRANSNENLFDLINTNHIFMLFHSGNTPQHSYPKSSSIDLKITGTLNALLLAILFTGGCASEGRVGILSRGFSLESDAGNLLRNGRTFDELGTVRDKHADISFC